MLLYGRSGTGKTTLWATFPGPILAIVCSGGSKPGELRSINTPEYRKKITPLIIQSILDYQRLITEEAPKYATVVLDHASGLQDLTLKQILGVDELPAQLTWGTANQQQWGQLALQMKEMLRSLLSLPGNSVVVAQEREFEPVGSDDDTMDSVITPTIGADLIPSVARWLNPACDYVVQTFLRPRMETIVEKIGGKNVEDVRRGKGVEYCLRTEPHDIYQTKFRVPRGTPLPDAIVDPTYERILQVIRGGK